MAETDRQRLLERALALPGAHIDDFYGERTPPHGADPKLLKRIDDTGLRTKLIAVGLAQGLQSPKGPQKIASILRIYPAFDAPSSSVTNGRVKQRPKLRPRRATQPPARRFPQISELERLVTRYREVEAEVAGELSVQLDDEIAQLKRDVSEFDGEPLEAAYRELGVALNRRRALASQISAQTFRRLEDDSEFPEREFLHLLAR